MWKAVSTAVRQGRDVNRADSRPDRLFCALTKVSHGCDRLCGMCKRLVNRLPIGAGGYRSLRTLEGEIIVGHDDRSIRAKRAVAAPASSSSSTRSTRRTEREQLALPPAQNSEQTIRKRPAKSRILLKNLCSRFPPLSVHLLQPFESDRGATKYLQNEKRLVDSETSWRLCCRRSLRKSLRLCIGADSRRSLQVGRRSCRG